MNTHFPKKHPLATLIPLLLAGFNFSTYAAEQESEKSQLEVIEVTAQKRVQNLQDVPVAVTAISGDALAEGVIKDVFDLQSSVPGLTVTESTSPAAATFSIRGVGTSSLNLGLESSVGLYMDGIYRARQGALTNNFYDVSSVEVLRGPQGTLFGKNTPSGAVQVKSVAPDHDGSGYLEVNLGNLGLQNFGFAKSLSAIDEELAFRVSGFSSSRDGFVNDLNLGDNTINDKNRYGGRVQALYTPNAELSIKIIGDYAKLDEICCSPGTTLNNYSATGVPGKMGTDSLLSSPLFNADIINADQYGDYLVAFNYLPEIEIKDRGVSAQIDWRLTDNLDFVSISGFRKFDSVEAYDTDYTTADLFNRLNETEQSSFSQELRFDISAEKLNGSVGVFYFEQEIDGLAESAMGTDMNNYVLKGLSGGRFDSVLNGINAISQMTGGLVAPAAPAMSNASYGAVSHQEHSSWAVFTQFDYQLTEQLTLTAGLRYTDEEKDLTNRFTENYASGAEHSTLISSIGNPAFPQTITPDSLLFNLGAAGQALQGITSGAITVGSPQFMQAIQTFVPFQQEAWYAQILAPLTAQRPDVSEEISDEQVSGTIKLAYQPSKDMLFYASYGTGYKSGGINTDRVAESVDLIFDSESSKSFEVGLKADFPESNLRVNLAAHHTITEDFQSNVFIGNGFALQNAGDYEADGIEVESLWIPIQGTRLLLAYSYTDAVFKTFEQGPCWSTTPWQTGTPDPKQQFLPNGAPAPYCDRSGDRPYTQPKTKGVLTLEQEFSLSDDIYSYVAIEFNYVGDIYTEASGDEIALIDARNAINARVFFNLEEYDMDIVLWGRNIGDDAELSSQSLAAPLQQGKLLNFYKEPATYGVSVKKRF